MDINNFKEPLEPELSLTIERLNKFLNSHSFNITYPFDVEVKINVTNIKPMITIGEWSDVIEYTISLEKTQDVTGKIILNHLSKIEQTQDYSIKRGEHKNTYFVLYEIKNSMNSILREFLKYFNINNYVDCTRIINKISGNHTKNINESLLNEGKYSSVIRQVVKDILKIFKHQKEGDYQLPEEISGRNMVYEFPQLKSSFTVNLSMRLNDEIDTIDVDGAYYPDEDTIDIIIESNPNLDRETLEELHFELNELVAHELQHLIQKDSGYEFPKKEPKKSLKYYTQSHELESQIIGFKRRAQKERKPFEDIVRNWFNKNQSKHNLNPKNMEIVINQILKSK